MSSSSIRLRPRDARAVAAVNGFVEAFPNTASWYNNASFLLPLAATVVVAVFAALRRSSELFGFAAFLGVITLAMVPVVLAGWRHTATAVVLSRDGIAALHDGRTLKSIPWNRVRTVRQRETQGNIRWEVTTGDDESLLLDGEIQNVERVVSLAKNLSGSQER